MDHYLIVLAQNGSSQYLERQKKRREYDSESDDSDGEDPASLLAFDLLDHSVQEAEIDVHLFAAQEDYNFTKYGENQILKYDSENPAPESFICITVESFMRKTFDEKWALSKDKSSV